MRKPLYRYPLRQAAANDEVKAWRESHRENIRCRDAMDISIRHHFDGMHLDDCAEELCDEFGADRVAWVLASTIQHADNIIYLSKGEIVEQGTHQELLAKKGRYYGLYTLQYDKQTLLKANTSDRIA